ncbi:MAG: DUF6797 domain-containing protein [Opitutaceae bacterium]
MRIFPAAFPLLLRALVLAGAMVVATHAEVRIERTWLPHDTAPSSFAIGLPGGVNFCFDPVRGGVSYVWKGDFLDLSSVRPGPGKFISPAKLLGPIAYRETGAAPLRRGDPARVPTVEFTGYTLHHDDVEFRYTIDGVPVREEIRIATGGDTLVRRLHVSGDTDVKWWRVIDGRPASELKREPDGSFVIEMPLAKVAP